MDLSKLDSAAGANEGFEVTLFNPATAADTDIKIRVLGRDSDAFRRVNSEQNRRRMAKMTKGGVYRPGTTSLEDVEQDTIALLAACTVSWTNVMLDGAVIEFSKEAATKLYTKFAWVREQVDAAVSDRANFIKGSPPA